MLGLESRSEKHFVPRWDGTLSDHVISLTWSPDRRLLGAASVSGPITLFGSTDGKPVQQLAGHGFGTTMIAWHPTNAQKLASAGQDGLVKLWDLQATSAGCLDLKGGAAWVERLAWSGAGSFLVSAAGKKLRLWDSTGKLVREFPDHPSTITDVKWRPGGVELASSAYGKLQIWNPDKAEPLFAFEWKGSMLVLAWSPDGRYIATGDQDSTVHFWIMKTGRDLQMSGYPTKVRELSWDHKGRFLATGGGPIPCVWDCSGKGPEGTTPLMLKSHQDTLSAVVFQNRGSLLASGGQDGQVNLWHPGKSDQPLSTLEMNSPISQLVWSPDDQNLAVGTDSGQVVVLGLA